MPLSTQIRNILLEEFGTRYQRGDLLPPEVEIAKRFDVSVLTVREAMQGLVSQGFIERRRGRGTIVLSTDTRSNRPKVGILIEADVSHPNTSPNYLIIASRLRKRLEEEGYSSQLFLGTLQPGRQVSTPTCREMIEAVQAKTVSALIVLSWITPEWRKRIEAQGVPVIRFGNDCPVGVRSDVPGFIEEALHRLLSQGRRHVALMSWNGAEPTNLASERTEHFKKLVEGHGLFCPPEWIRGDIDSALVGAGWEVFREIWLSHERKPDAMIVTDDVLFQGVLIAFGEMEIPSTRIALAVLSLDASSLPTPRGSIRYDTSLEETVSNGIELAVARMKGHLIQDPLRIIRGLPRRHQLVDASEETDPAVENDEHFGRKPTNQCHMRRSGFSLIEILVSVAILALVAVLVFSMIELFKNQSAAARCVSNLRQIGVALNLYAADHGVFPFHQVGSTRWYSGSNDKRSFFAGPYLGQTAIEMRYSGSEISQTIGGVFDCPAIETADKEGLGWDNWIVDSIDYGQNLTLCGRSPAEIANPARTVAVVEGGNFSRIRAEWTNGRTYHEDDGGVVVVPGGTQWNYGEKHNTRSPIIYPHSGHAHFLFVDGHVSQHQHHELDESWFDGK